MPKTPGPYILQSESYFAISCVTLGKSLNFNKTQDCYQRNSPNNGTLSCRAIVQIKLGHAGKAPDSGLGTQ